MKQDEFNSKLLNLIERLAAQNMKLYCYSDRTDDKQSPQWKEAKSIRDDASALIAVTVEPFIGVSVTGVGPCTIDPAELERMLAQPDSDSMYHRAAELGMGYPPPQSLASCQVRDFTFPSGDLKAMISNDEGKTWKEAEFDGMTWRERVQAKRKADEQKSADDAEYESKLFKDVHGHG